MIDYKNLLLAILVAYVVLDLSFALLLKRKRPLLFKHAMIVSKKESRTLLLSVIVAAVAGGATFYFVNKN